MILIKLILGVIIVLIARGLGIALGFVVYKIQTSTCKLCEEIDKKCECDACRDYEDRSRR